MPDQFADHRRELEDAFQRAESAFLAKQPPVVPPGFAEACDPVFASRTQAYREVLVGCLLTRLIDPTRNVRLPYLDLGDAAYSGRSLDERVVNPFLHQRSIPCSRGPFLSVFRRQVGFDPTTRSRLRDKKGYDGLLALIANAESCDDRHTLIGMLDYVIYRFILLREAAKVDLLQLERLSLRQHERLIGGLLARPSGGEFPCVLVLSMVETIVERFRLPWTVTSQGINVCDAAAGAAGDISVYDGEKLLLAIEVTERAVDAPRVQATFRSKISASATPDYVFVVNLAQVHDDAIQQAEKYFSQGHDVSFADIRAWLVNTLVTVGAEGRRLYHKKVREHLSAEGISTALKVGWNEEVEKLTR